MYKPLNHMKFAQYSMYLFSVYDNQSSYHHTDCFLLVSIISSFLLLVSYPFLIIAYSAPLSKPPFSIASSPSSVKPSPHPYCQCTFCISPISITFRKKQQHDSIAFPPSMSAPLCQHPS